MLTPRNDGLLRVRSHRIRILPKPTYFFPRPDFFGNYRHAFSIEQSHRQLKIVSTSRVQVLPRILPSFDSSPQWEAVVAAVQGATDDRWLEASPFLFNSRYIRQSSDFADYARQDFIEQRPILVALSDFMARIHREFIYDPNATIVHTLPHEAFLMKRGVCQDFAQVSIAALRSIGLAARYVSGYLRTHSEPGQPRLVGADQSHAWVSLYCGAEIGWVDFDPTNNRFCSTEHVPIAWGRDYQDVVPVRGVFLGGGQHQLVVTVDVQPMQR